MIKIKQLSKKYKLGKTDVCALSNINLEINNKESNLKDYNLRMQNQLPRNEKLKKATFILKNEGSLEDLKSSVYLLFQKLTNYQE